MPKRLNPLSPSAIANAKPKDSPYAVRDGLGLFVMVNPDGAKLWRFDYRRPDTGKRNTLSLGTYPDVSLKRAREKRDEARKLLADGIDPGVKRQAEKTAAVERAANSFEAVAREWLLVRKPGWTEKQYDKEVKRLEKHAFPYIGHRAIAELDVDDIRSLIERVWNAGYLEQAHRLRFQLSRVYRFAIGTKRAKHDPAAALSEVLPSRRDMVKSRMPTITDTARVAELLRAMDGFTGSPVVRAALRLAPLWFCRPGEIRMAEWANFDLEGEHPTYRVPPIIRKLKKREKLHPDTPPHIIPLSSQALAILRELQPLTGRGQYLFPGARSAKRSMSDGAVNAALARMGFKGEMVGHGFRHMASTMLREMGWSRDAVEAQLSHKVGGTEGVYNMAQHLPERRKMMKQWADYLDALRTGSNVIPFKRDAAGA
ncbi:MAG: integrase arm-type DNA-binding domain-containing protein [Proteobacteria bacterium]|nr:integrase arm-type DNA-binding domain-containing protein [Pseudomonadota bacterium]